MKRLRSALIVANVSFLLLILVATFGFPVVWESEPGLMRTLLLAGLAGGLLISVVAVLVLSSAVKRGLR